MVVKAQCSSRVHISEAKHWTMHVLLLLGRAPERYEHGTRDMTCPLNLQDNTNNAGKTTVNTRNTFLFPLRR